MEQKLLFISIIICSLIYVLCIFFQFYSFLKFKLLVRKNGVVSLMDNLYEVAIYIVGFLLLGMYFSSISDMLININQYANGKLPFIIYANH